MNTRIAPNSRGAPYFLIPAGLAWISLIIRWGIMLRMAGLIVAICAWILLSDRLKTGKKGVNHGLRNSNT